MNRDDYGKMKHLDVSFNALTNKSLFFLHALSQQNVSILAIHNLFDFGSVKAKFQEFVTLISRPIPLQKIDGLNNLEELMVTLTNNVNKLSTTSLQHTDIIPKRNEQLEQKLVHYLRRYGYSQITEQIKGFQHETDLFLVSSDGKKIIIGEAQKELQMVAFDLVEERSVDFTKISNDDLPERLKCYEEIIQLVGCETYQQKHMNIAKQCKIVLARSLNDQFVIFDLHDFSDRMNITTRTLC
ncbi:DNA-directed RNA polymerase subunit beta [Acrasis kona]|uniref:DNA-directed RNA polymerase subunit beta n=1 Tax=Acrasis kona TaxID=1008807 RepID=A0AAW2ZFM3_9EUKA